MRSSTPILISALAFLCPLSAAAQWYSCGTGKCRTDTVEPGESVPTQCATAPCQETSSDLNTAVKYTRVTYSGTQAFDTTDQYSTNGSAEQMEWNSDSTLFYVGSINHGIDYFEKLDRGTGLTSLVTCSFVADDCFHGLLATYDHTADGPMSAVSPYIYWSMYGTTISKMDFTATMANPASADTNSTLYDFTSCPSIPRTDGANELAMDNRDDRFLTTFGPSQDNWSVVGVYDTTQHCRWFNTATFSTGGDWGSSGAVSYFDESGGSITNDSCSQIHNVRMSRDGVWARISTQCGGGSGDIYFWQIATGNVYRNRGGGDVSPNYGGGHQMIGFNSIFVNNAVVYSPPQWFAKRTIPPTGTPTFLTTPGTAGFDDTHISWNNQASGQLQPIFVSAYQTSAPTQAWGDEIFAVSTDGSGTVYRFGYAYSRAHDFNAQIMANVSRDGCWAAFTTDHTTSRDDVYLVGPLPATGGCGTGGHGGGGGGGEPPPPSALLWVVQ